MRVLTNDVDGGGGASAAEEEGMKDWSCWRNSSPVGWCCVEGDEAKMPEAPESWEGGSVEAAWVVEAAWAEEDDAAAGFRRNGLLDDSGGSAIVDVGESC